MRTGKKAALITLLVLVLILAGMGTAVALYIHTLDQELSPTNVYTSQEMRDIEDSLVPLTSYNEPFYMMLIGSDARDDSEEVGSRADTAILARIDAPKAQLTLISIPRDTMIELEGYGTQKFNAAYAYGSVGGTIKAASELCGVDISHFAEVDFPRMISFVDMIGGVDVEVAEEINDPDAGDIVIPAGVQHLDGASALVFARSRAYADGDFTRASNQRLLIEAILNKILTLPVNEMLGVVQNVATSVTTDLEALDLMSLASQFQAAETITMYSSMVPSAPDMVGEVSYVVIDEAIFARLMEVVREGGDPNTVFGFSEEANTFVPREAEIPEG